MTAWSIFWKAVKAFLGWLFLTAIFILSASFTTGFRAYCPITSFIYGSVAVFFLILILGWAMGAFED
jgi:hypothetical protein